MVTAAPVVCCAAGLLVLFVLKHHQAALAAEYAARHMTPFPAAQGWNGEPSSFLHVSETARDVIVRNPAQWGMAIAMASFALSPLLLIAAVVMVYGAVTSNHTALLGGLVPFLALAWYAYAPMRMVVEGRELVLDAGQGSLTLNGHRLTALTNIHSFEGRTVHRTKGGVDFHLLVVLRSGTAIEIGGPDDRPDIVDAAQPLNVALSRLCHAS